MQQTNKPKIFIAGSSWARGEWDPDRPVVLHNGIKQYFADDGYTVVDCSQARSYHIRVINHLNKKLAHHHNDNDIVFFIMADPLLDIIMPELSAMQIKRSTNVVNLPLFSEAVAQCGGLLELIRKQQDIIYGALNQVAKQHNITIHCIGGTYNVNTALLAKYTNLLSTVTSWIYLLVGQYQEHPDTDRPNFGISYTWNIDYIDFSKYSADFAQQIRQEFDAISDRTKIMNELIFHPDGLHPNREGHKILYNHLTNLLHL